MLRRLQPEPPHHIVITVGGTNGKGSCVALLEAILRAAGYRVGAYTSPHLLRYNERIRIDGAEVGDDALCRTFARIDAARGEISLTYFEFGTLAALELFREAGVEVAVLEVGLGGRLDAVNIVDADAALVVSIGIDHTDWLGPAAATAIGLRESGHLSHRPAGDLRRSRSAAPAGRTRPRHRRPTYRQVGRDYGFRPHRPDLALVVGRAVLRRPAAAGAGRRAPDRQRRRRAHDSGQPARSIAGFRRRHSYRIDASRITRPLSNHLRPG